MKSEVRQIFVLGSPRSGTTLMGNYIGSSPLICNLGEYSAFHFSHEIAVKAYERVPSPYKDIFLQELQLLASSLAARIATEQDCQFYCDSTPWNLLIMQSLTKTFPNAIFILMLRHYSGVILSLARSYRDQYLWATDKWSARAALWSSFYENTSFLPLDRTIVISYERLCAEPKSTIENLENSLMRLGLNGAEFDETQLAKSHATNRKDQRPTIVCETETGQISFNSISSFDLDLWTQSISEQVSPIVENTNNLLQNLFPETYETPEDFPFAN